MDQRFQRTAAQNYLMEFSGGSGGSFQPTSQHFFPFVYGRPEFSSPPVAGGRIQQQPLALASNYGVQASALLQRNAPPLPTSQDASVPPPTLSGSAFSPRGFGLRPLYRQPVSFPLQASTLETSIGLQNEAHRPAVEEAEDNTSQDDGTHEESDVSKEKDKRCSRGAAYRSWRMEDMIAAFRMCVEEGKKVSDAAAKFKVPEQSLRDRVQGRVALRARSGPKSFLSREEENEIVDKLLESQKDGKLVGKPDVEDMVMDIVSDGRQHPFKDRQGKKKPGSRWWRSFFSRHPEVSLGDRIPSKPFKRLVVDEEMHSQLRKQKHAAEELQESRRALRKAGLELRKEASAAYRATAERTENNEVQLESGPQVEKKMDLRREEVARELLQEKRPRSEGEAAHPAKRRVL